MTQPFPVCLERIWRYSWPVGDTTHVWTLLLYHGTWWRQDQDGETRMIDMAAPSMYYYDAGMRRWDDLEQHPSRRHWNLWHLLATRLLPDLDYRIQNLGWTVATVAEGARHGETRRYGVIPNLCMATIVDMALVMQEELGVRKSWYVSRLNRQHKADLLEAVMGLRDLYPDRWGPWGDIVDRLCTEVYEAWPRRDPSLFVWNHTEAFKTLFAHYNLAAFCAWVNQDATSKRRMEFHVAFGPRFRACRSVINLIVGFFLPRRS